MEVGLTQAGHGRRGEPTEPTRRDLTGFVGISEDYRPTADALETVEASRHDVVSAENPAADRG